MKNCVQLVYVVRDAGGEYIADRGGRTPASNEAKEFDQPQDAADACERGTDRVLSREIKGVTHD